ncbi:hypothetical protein GCM10027521_02150 [Amycolatopsis cihanbeyliensis]
MRGVTDDISSRLWNAGVSTQDDAVAGENYQNAVLEQYKLYVEMADRVSARRALANTFFLALNTSIFTVIGVAWPARLVATPWWLVIPLAALLAECAAWFYLVRSYRQLNTAKYQVVGALEERLPASPYWKAEWVALGEGRDRSRYWPLTHLEQWVPVLFGSIYLAGFVVALVA